MPNKISLLLVEDDSLLAPLYTRLLLSAGYQVVCCATAHETEQKLLTEKIDLVLLDMMLPDLNGLELFTRFRRLFPVPVVLLTNLDHYAVKEQAQKLGALGYMIKSDYTPDIFLDKIKGYLASLGHFR